MNDADAARLAADRLEVAFAAGGAEIDLAVVRETTSRGLERLPLEPLEAAAAARACVVAGRHCLRVFASAEAYGLARQGLQHAAALEDPERTRLEIESHEVRLAARLTTDRDGDAGAG